MRQIASIIAEHPFFKGMEQDDLNFIAGCGSNRVLRKGDWMAREGQPANQFYVIRTGRVVVEIHVPGRGELAVLTLQNGDIVGWGWLFEPYLWRYDILVVEDTHVVAFDGKCLRDKCEEDQAMGYQLIKRFARIMTSRLDATRMQLLDVYGKKD